VLQDERKHMNNTSTQVTVTKVQMNALFSIYQDIKCFVDSNKEHQDVSKPEEDMLAIKGILDQLDTSELEYEKGN
jgi:hypothetical protein